MKVFGCTREGCYAGGIILVAANSIEEAIDIYRNDIKYYYQWSEYEEGEIYYLYYEPKRWKEYPQLSYNGDTPCVILEEGHTE